MNTPFSNSKPFLNNLISLWPLSSGSLSLKQLRNDIKEQSDRQVELRKTIDRIEVTVNEQSQVLNFIAQRLLTPNQDQH
ncbi:hypothetical protein [Nostoc sp.]|uniref:hypothetical protein n=1 Tax=Nostoc sp. TaxID=1180 RepID=UPI002FFD056E